jgi:hypothetical protein
MNRGSEHDFEGSCPLGDRTLMNTVETQKGFFKSITNYFERKYAGRYFSVILKELARIEPKAFLRILNVADITLPEIHKQALLDGELKIDLEWSFPGKGRRADLALYLEGPRPTLIIEVKAEDAMRKQQLDDYLAIVKANSRAKDREQRTSFLLLSRYALVSEEEQKLQTALKQGLPVGQLRHGQLHGILDDSGGTVARREYLEDCGMTFQDIDVKRDGAGLIHMAMRMLGANNVGHGRIRKLSGVDSMLSIMERLFGNIEVLATPIYARNRKMFGNRFRRDFEVEPWLDIPKGIQKTVFASGTRPVMDDADKSELICESFDVTGGTVWLYGVGRFVNPKYAVVSIGYYIELDRKKNKPSYGMFVEFEWNGSDIVEWEDRASEKSFSRFPSEAEAHKMLSGLLMDAKKKVSRTTKMFEPFSARIEG